MTKGFLGTGATLIADVNLVLQLLMAAALGGGAYLARRQRYTAHRFCQTSVVLLNLALIFGIMLPAFRVAPRHGLAHAVALAHGLLGALAELLGLYIVLVAGTSLLPPSLRFKDYKPWMRSALALWWTVIALGVGTYAVWYGPHASALAGEAVAGEAVVSISGFEFVPKELTIHPGTVVRWVGFDGRHSVVADDGTFSADDDAIKAGHFEHRFDKAGSFLYSCEYHGSKLGKGMSGVIHVQP